jgi:two-component system, cell cycle response regulator DivK
MEQASILLVEDNVSNSKLARILLEREGHVVHTARDAYEALQALGSYVPRLILMDIQLPGMDGLTLTRKLKSEPRTRDIPVVAMTAYAMKGDESQALAAGCQGYITKPIDTRHFAADVLGHLSQAAARSKEVAEAASRRRRDFEAAFSELRAEYMVGLADYVEDLRRHAPPGANPQEERTARDGTLARIAHKLAGTGSTYGFPAITEAARALEQDLKRRKPDEAIADAVRKVETACREAMSGSPPPM